MSWNGTELGEHWEPMVRAARGVLRSREDAEDCAGQAVLQVLSRQPVGVDNAEAYLVTIAKRRAIDRHRAQERVRRRDVRLAGQVQLSAPDAADDVVHQAEALWMQQQAQQLLDPKVFSLLRAVADGEDLEAVASGLGMTKRAAQSHLHRARRLLRTVWATSLAGIGVIWGLAKRSVVVSVPVGIALAFLLAPDFHPGLATGSPTHHHVAQDRPRHAVPNGGPQPLVAPAARRLTVVSRPKASPPQPSVRRSTPRVAGTGHVITEPLGANTAITHQHEGTPTQDGPVNGGIDCVKHLQVTSKKIGC